VTAELHLLLEKLAALRQFELFEAAPKQATLELRLALPADRIPADLRRRVHRMLDDETMRGVHAEHPIAKVEVRLEAARGEP
jgi:hypothetical protein